MMHIDPSFNENIVDLYQLRDKLLGFRNSIKSSPYVASTPYCRIQIDIWEDMMRLVDEILKNKPKITKIKNWEIGNHFISSRYPDVIYTVIGFPSFHSLQGEGDTFGKGAPSIIVEHESLCFPYSGEPPKNMLRVQSEINEARYREKQNQEVFKAIQTVEKEDNLKRKLKNKPEEKNKPKKEKKKFAIGITSTEKKKAGKKAKKHFKTGNLFDFKEDKKDKKKKHKKK